MKIVIALDGSKFAEDILIPASELAARGGDCTEVHLIRVVDPREAHITWLKPPGLMERSSSIGGTGGRAYSSYRSCDGVSTETDLQAQDRHYQHAKFYLETVANKFFPRSGRTKVVFGTKPAEEILAYSRKEKTDLIAIATHGRTGLAKTMLGSVAAELMRSHVAPLLMVCPTGLKDTAGTTTIHSKTKTAGSVV